LGAWPNPDPEERKSDQKSSQRHGRDSEEGYKSYGTNRRQRNRKYWKGDQKSGGNCNSQAPASSQKIAVGFAFSFAEP
jgi:hypothetical protein